MKIIKDALRDFDIRHSISIFDIYFLSNKKVKPYALQYNCLIRNVLLSKNLWQKQIYLLQIP